MSLSEMPLMGMGSIALTGITAVYLHQQIAVLSAVIVEQDKKIKDLTDLMNKHQKNQNALINDLEERTARITKRISSNSRTKKKPTTKRRKKKEKSESEESSSEVMDDEEKNKFAGLF